MIMQDTCIYQEYLQFMFTLKDTYKCQTVWQQATAYTMYSLCSSANRGARIPFGLDKD